MVFFRRYSRLPQVDASVPQLLTRIGSMLLEADQLASRAGGWRIVAIDFDERNVKEV
jgi:hypothetical protein